MPKLHATPKARVTRFESDVEVLHFPEGGVFGKPTGHGDPTTIRFDAAGEAERAIERIQHHFESLREQVDSYASFRLRGDSQWHPPAA